VSRHDKRARETSAPQPTSAERRLWRELRQLKQIGCKFRQQVPIDHFIATSHASRAG
jgi:very-short-patch-repair endonuclease